MTLIHRKNKKQQPVIIGLAVLSVIIVIVMIVFLAFKDDDKDKNEVAQEIESSTAFEMLPTEQVEETTEYGEKAGGLALSCKKTTEIICCFFPNKSYL